jgi:HlyD family secretion protein
MAVLAVVGAVTVYSVPAVSKPIKGFFGPSSSDIITFPVRRGPLPITVVERGSLESSSNQDVYCRVEGQTTIIRIVPEGTRVKKDEVICELDSAALKDSLVNQRITTESAKANYQNAKLTREVAEIAVIEYTEGIFIQDLATVEGEIKLAEADVTRSEDRLDWARRMYDKGYVSKATAISEELTFKKSQFAFEQAESKLKVLVQYTKGKTIKELGSEVEKSKSDELAKQATWELEKGKELKLERQIAACTLTAPIDGLVVYANDPGRGFGSTQPQIEEGATVRERQKIISIPDITKMQVNAKVHESQIDKIASRMKSLIRIDAFADQVLNGTVNDVAPLPDPGNFFSSDIKVYTTHIKIDDGLALGLRPGMTAQVEILVDRLENILSVPVQAILQYNGKDHVTKKIGDRFEPIEVEVGSTNEKFVQVKKGLDEGDIVVLNPMSLMTEEEKREAFRSSSKESKKEWGPGGPEGEAGKGGPAAATKGEAPGKGGDPAKSKGKGTGKAKGKGGRGGGNPIFQKMAPEDRQKFFRATDEEKSAILKKAGMPDDQIEQTLERMKNFQGGGGGFGGGGRGRQGGGPPGGGDQ